MTPSEPRCHSFGEFRIDSIARRLSRHDGTPVALTARVFDTLLYLVRHAGISLSKDELLGAIWPGRVVEENNLTQSISTLRKVLGADADGQRYIVTEPGRGYRFVAQVHAVTDAPTRPESEAPSTATLDALPPPAPGAARPFSLPGRVARTGVLLGSLLVLLVAAAAWLWHPRRFAARDDADHDGRGAAVQAAAASRP